MVIDPWKLVGPKPIATVFVFGIAVFLLFYRLGVTPLEDWDEAYYVLKARAAIQTGEYLVPAIHPGFPLEGSWDKSLFALYPMIISFKLFGITELTARLSSAFFGLGTFVQVFLIARRFFGHWTGILAVLIIATITQLMFEHGLRRGDIDSITLFFVTGAVSSWLLIKRVDVKIILTMASLAFAFLCKGPIIGIPIVIVLSSLLSENPISKRHYKTLLYGILVFCAIALPWYVYMYSRFGDTFVQAHVVRVFFQWFSRGVEPHIRDDMYLIREVLLSTRNFPWFGAALISIIYFFRLYAKDKRLVEFVLISWVITAFLVINASKTKIVWYVFPLYPPLAIMTAKTLMDFVENRNYLNKLAYYVGLMVILVVPFTYRIFPHNTTSNAARAAMAALGVFAVVTLIERYLPKCSKALSSVLVCLLCVVPGMMAYELAMFTYDHPIFPILASLEPGKPIYALRLLQPGARYYLSLRGDLRECYEFADMGELRGRTVVTRTEYSVLFGRKNPDGSYQLAVGDEHFVIRPVKTSNEYSIVRID